MKLVSGGMFISESRKSIMVIFISGLVCFRLLKLFSVCLIVVIMVKVFRFIVVYVVVKKMIDGKVKEFLFSVIIFRRKYLDWVIDE